MAGPLSSEEIEDVVSSVRRLVSNEQAPRRQSRDDGADRLLLTPSLRVVSETSPLAPLILEAPMVEAVPDPVDESDILPEAAESEADADLIEADWEDELWVAPEVVSLGEVALGAEEAEVLLPPAQEMPESFASEPDHEPDEAAEAWAEAGHEWVEDEPVPFLPLRRRAENLAARLAAGSVGEPPRSEPRPEPVPEVANLTADLDLDDDSDQHQPASAEVGPEAPQRMPTEILDADGTPLAVLDEAALQEIVRQMIREELQGKMGERITSNVRKLVRAEINRALIARDLD